MKFRVWNKRDKVWVRISTPANRAIGVVAEFDTYPEAQEFMFRRASLFYGAEKFELTWDQHSGPWKEGFAAALFRVVPVEDNLND